jgi:hypothetical protein
MQTASGWDGQLLVVKRIRPIRISSKGSTLASESRDAMSGSGTSAESGRNDDQDDSDGE